MDKKELRKKRIYSKQRSKKVKSHKDKGQLKRANTKHQLYKVICTHSDFHSKSRDVFIILIRIMMGFASPLSNFNVEDDNRYVDMFTLVSDMASDCSDNTLKTSFVMHYK